MWANPLLRYLFVVTAICFFLKIKLDICHGSMLTSKHVNVQR